MLSLTSLKVQNESFWRRFKAIGVTRCPITSKLWVTGSGDQFDIGTARRVNAFPS